MKQQSFYFIFIQLIKNKIKRWRIRPIFPKTQDSELSPIFIIGTNRSGTSIISNTFSQHPEVEGMFHGSTSPTLSEKCSHTIGYCESMHLWGWDISPLADFIKGTSDAPCWGHPKFISQIYKDSPRNDLEARKLISAIHLNRKTNKIPLIKDQFNILKIRLIKKLFPRARFILVFRSPEDYIKSCHHKWFNEKYLPNYPSISIHWLTLNTLAIGELQQYSENDFVTICYNDLIESKDMAKTILDECTHKLGLKKFNYNLENISKAYKFFDDNKYNKFNFDYIANLMESESKAMKK